MSQWIRKGAVLLMTLVLVTGCADMSPRQRTGAVVGGATGAAVGAGVSRDDRQMSAIIVGAVIGTVIGAAIGRQMDEQDRRDTARALEHNRNRQASAWHNRRNGNRYQVTPVREYVSHGRRCREFRLDANVDGRPRESMGNACRGPDGRWRMMP